MWAFRSEKPDLHHSFPFVMWLPGHRCSVSLPLLSPAPFNAGGPLPPSFPLPLSLGDLRHSHSLRYHLPVSDSPVFKSNTDHTSGCLPIDPDPCEMAHKQHPKFHLPAPELFLSPSALQPHLLGSLGYSGTHPGAHLRLLVHSQLLNPFCMLGVHLRDTF